jgi:hypothetical protein
MSSKARTKAAVFDSRRDSQSRQRTDARLHSRIWRIRLRPGSCLWRSDGQSRSVNYLNPIVIDKQPQLQFSTMAKAREHCARGAGIWKWCSNLEAGPGPLCRPRLHRRGHDNDPVRHGRSEQDEQGSSLHGCHTVCSKSGGKIAVAVEFRQRRARGASSLYYRALRMMFRGFATGYGRIDQTRHLTWPGSHHRIVRGGLILDLRAIYKPSPTSRYWLIVMRC